MFCGQGNNAGDGFVLAACAREAGFEVSVIQLGDAQRLRGDARVCYESMLQTGVDSGAGCPGIEGADVIVDALLGTGLDRAVRDPYLASIRSINEQTCPVLSIDVPSGINATTGQCMGAAVVAAELRVDANLADERGLAVSDPHQLVEYPNAVRPILDVLTSWDGLWYMEIVRSGYPRTIPPDVTYHVDEARAAFFPLFPLLGRAFDTVLPGGDSFAVLTMNAIVSVRQQVAVSEFCDAVREGRPEAILPRSQELFTPDANGLLAAECRCDALSASGRMRECTALFDDLLSRAGLEAWRPQPRLAASVARARLDSGRASEALELVRHAAVSHPFDLELIDHICEYV